jgi:mannan endo-1,4-beta-mannosidase
VLGAGAGADGAARRARREDPSIFGYNLMNEPRSQNQLYLVRRQTTDGSRMYNISYNPGDDLQSWIEESAAFVKAIDPIHLLSTGAQPCPPILP